MSYSGKRIGLTSVLCIAVFYLASILLGDALSAQVGIAKSYTALLSVLFSSVILICLRTSGNELEWRISPISTSSGRQLGYLIPLCMFALTGVCSSLKTSVSVPEMACCFVSACGMAFVEEMLFRGLLLRTLSERYENPKAAIFVSGLTFGIWEITALFCGNCSVSTILLLACDFAVGVALSAFVLQTQNLLPCILCHAARNLLCSFATTPSATFRICGSVAAIFAAILFTQWMLKLAKQKRLS